MTLAAGTRLGPYEITEPIGKGGMGEVYRAHDTKLERDVAIKVLPDEFAKDDQRLARFEREAKLLASLNHPNIASIHGFEEADGVKALVLELVEGPTLAERIAEGPIPIEEALAIAKQIAEALEMGHEAGVIHRDLKPANIKLREDGTVKVLDYGLAKAFTRQAPDDAQSQSPTFTRNRTEAGVILGTAPYMSPEQARGKAVDKRTDLWAFGCCLYEALTGKSAFLGDTVTDTIARIVEREPDLDALPARTPVSVRRLLRRCFEKDPSRRFRDAGDAILELQDTGETPGVSSRRPTGSAIPWGIAGIAVATLVLWPSPAVVTPTVVRSSIDLPSTLATGYDELFSPRYPVLSPDGTRLVYLAYRANEGQLYVRGLESDESLPLLGTEGAGGGNEAAFFSPDGEWVGFFADEKLKKVRLDGGVGAVTLTEVLRPRGGDWGPDGNIVFGRRERGMGLARISPEGGAPEVLTTVEDGEFSHRYPQVLPNGKAVLFLVTHGATIDDSRIIVQSLENGERRVLGNASYARYVPSGHLVYAREKTLYAAPFDLDRLEVRGTGVPVQSGVSTPPFGASGHGDFSVSPNGTLVYRPAHPVNRQLFLVGLDGKRTPLAAPSDLYQTLRFAPGGDRLAVTTEEGHVYVYDLEHERLTLRTSEFEDASGRLWRPVASVAWSPDGNRLAFSATTTGTSVNLFVASAGGERVLEPLLDQEMLGYVDDWSPDGARLLYNQMDDEEAAGNPWAIWELPLATGGEAQRVVDVPRASAHSANVSRDGRWLVYNSNQSGSSELYVRAYDDHEGARQISTEGGRAPVWAPSGREVYFRSGDNIMAIEIAIEPRLSAGRSRTLFEWAYRPGSPVRRHFDISPDGRQFVMMQPEGPALPPRFKLVQNWFRELERLVPTND